MKFEKSHYWNLHHHKTSNSLINMDNFLVKTKDLYLSNHLLNYLLDYLQIKLTNNLPIFTGKKNSSLKVERKSKNKTVNHSDPKEENDQKGQKTKNPQTKQKKLNQNRPHLNQQRRSKLPSQKEPQQQTDAHKNILNPAQRFFLKQLEEKIPSLQIQLSTQNKEKYQRVKEQNANVNNINTLFKIKQFKPIWEEYFKNGKMYTDLEESRVNDKNKEIFRKILQVFKVGFERQEFKGIRYLIEENRRKLRNMFRQYLVINILFIARYYKLRLRKKIRLGGNNNVRLNSD